MPGSKHFKRLERLYVSAPTNQYYRPALTIEEGAATVTIAVDPKMFHAADAVHGSVYFKALDDAAFFAVNSLVEDEWVLTASFNIHLVRPVASGEMTAKGRIVHVSRRLFIAEAELTDSQDQRLAWGSGTFMRSGIPLPEASSDG